jgi:predicted PurR-regulated permease PerM
MTWQYDALFRRLVFLGVLIAVAVLLFLQLNFFVGAFLGATTIYVVLRGTMFRMVERRGMRHWTAALLLVGASALVLTAFGWVAVTSVGAELQKIEVEGLIDTAKDLLVRVNDRLNLSIDPHEIMGHGGGMLRGVLNATYSFAANIVMMLFILYFMLTGGRRMERHICNYSPFRDRSLVMIKHELRTMIYSNAVGIPVILILQTLVSTLIYWLLGFVDPWFWGFLTALCGLVPVLGTMVVYVPMSIWLMVDGSAWDGVALLLYGATVISNADNVLRIVLLHKVADTHPMVVIFGVIAGIPFFGFWGIIFGPLLISGFILLIKIYYLEYGLLHDCDAEPTVRSAKPRKSVPPHFRKIHSKMCDSNG